MGQEGGGRKGLWEKRNRGIKTEPSEGLWWGMNVVHDDSGWGTSGQRGENENGSQIAAGPREPSWVA